MRQVWKTPSEDLFHRELQRGSFKLESTCPVLQTHSSNLVLLHGHICTRRLNWWNEGFRRPWVMIHDSNLQSNNSCKQLLVYRMLWIIFPNEKLKIVNCNNCLIELSLSDPISGPVFEHVLITPFPSRVGPFWSIRETLPASWP